MMLRIKDNSQNKADAFSDINNLSNKIVDKTLDELEREGVFVFPEFLRDAEDVTRDQTIIHQVGDTYRTGNLMGFLGFGNERLIIESRFSGGEGRDFFFLYLLSKVLDFPNILDMKTNADESNPLLNYLLFVFPYYLKAAMRCRMNLYSLS